MSLSDAGPRSRVIARLALLSRLPMTEEGFVDGFATHTRIDA
jgi:hypothetical protein